MHQRFCLILFLLSFFAQSVSSQEYQASVRDELLMIRLIPQLSFNMPDASDIISGALLKKSGNDYKEQEYYSYNFYQKTSVNILMNKDTSHSHADNTSPNENPLSKRIINTFKPWIEFARPTNNPEEIAMTILLHENYKKFHKENDKKYSYYEGIRNKDLFEIMGEQNIVCILDEVLSDIDLYQNKVEILLKKYHSPLAENALNIYKYRLHSIRQINGKQCFQISFFAENEKENTFLGYLYISADGNFSLLKAEFTLSNPENNNFLKDLFIRHDYTLKDSVYIPSQKQSCAIMGDEINGSLIIDRINVYSDFSFNNTDKTHPFKSIPPSVYNDRDNDYWNKIRPVPLTASQEQIEGLQHVAYRTRSYKNLQHLIHIFMTNHVTLGGVNGIFELGPLSQFLSYNKMEGVRLKLGGNTTPKLFNRLMAGGYVAYGTDDEKIKYRGDISYSFLPRDKSTWEYPKRFISFSYVNDLNIPGQDILTSERDHFTYSFSHASTNNMSLQRVAQLTFENENNHHFSYKIGGKFTYDRPEGVVKYMQTKGTDTVMINNISTSEINLSLRYAPGEKFFQSRDKRHPFQEGNIRLDLSHRIGIKDLFGSDYNYHITEFKAYKKFTFPMNTGHAGLRISGGKIWNKIPFPLLFILEGNQSYMYRSERYNCVNFYELITDNYIAGNLDLMFNWSPIKLVYSKSKIKTSLGIKTLYGPLSDKNNPDIHSSLFVFNHGVTPLGKTPYIEANIGLSNVFKVLRIEYVRRLTYLDHYMGEDRKPTKGSLFFTGSFSF